MSHKILSLSRLTDAEYSNYVASFESTKKYYNKLMAYLAAYFNSNSFLFSSVGARNSYSSSVFDTLCEINFIMKQTRVHDYTHVHVQSLYASKIIKNIFAEKKLNIKVTCQEKLTARMLIRPYLRFFFNIWRLFCQEIISRRLVEKTFSQSTKKPYTLIDTFILQSSINKNGKFNDRYFTDIHQYIMPNRSANILFIPSFASISNYFVLWRRLQDLKSPIKFLPREYFLRIEDYFGAFKDLYLQSKIKFPRLFYMGINIEALLSYDNRINKYCSSHLHSLLNYRFVKKLKENNIPVDLYIDWYENQTIDKSMLKGFSDFYPEVQTKGYRGFTVDMSYNFHLFPNKYEIENGFAPHIICHIGTELTYNGEEETNNPLICQELAPAFRFYDAQQEKPQKNLSSIPYDYLFILPFGHQESIGLLKYAEFIAKSCEKKIIIVKFHPATQINYMPRFKNLIISNESVPELLDQAKNLISEASSACVEALCYNINIIIVNTRGRRVQNPLPERYKGQVTIIRSSKNLLTYLNQQENKVKKLIAPLSREALFQRPSIDNVKSFLTKSHSTQTSSS